MCAQALATKYVLKCLKLLLDHTSHVLKGTKQLAQAHFSPYRKKFLVMGDVVAFYPSLPLHHTIELIETIYDLGYPEKSKEEKEVFDCVLWLANYNLLCEFDGVTYRQLQGLAMGVACSPDIANLWGAFFEDWCFETDEVLKEHVPFY